MFRVITTFILVVAAYVSVVLGDLGYSYQFTTGYGLHPAIAALGIALMVLISWAAIWLLRLHERDTSTTDEPQYVSHEAITGCEPLELNPTWK